MARLESGIESLRAESLNVRDALTKLAVSSEAQKNSSDKLTQIATIFGLFLTALTLIAVFSDLI